MKEEDIIPSPREDMPILSLIQQIKDQTIDPRTLNKELRQQCVETLLFEGYLEAGIAQILKRSHKTIKRDIQDIRERNSLVPDMNFTKQFIGALLQKSEMHQGFLNRLARSKEGAVGDRAQAEYHAWKIAKETAEILQTLGHLPLKPKEVVGNIFHHESPDNSTCDSLRHRLSAIEITAQECGEIAPKTLETIQELRLQITKVELSEKIDHLAIKQEPSDGAPSRRPESD